MRITETFIKEILMKIILWNTNPSMITVCCFNILIKK